MESAVWLTEALLLVLLLPLHLSARTDKLVWPSLRFTACCGARCGLLAALLLFCWLTIAPSSFSFMTGHQARHTRYLKRSSRRLHFLASPASFLPLRLGSPSLLADAGTAGTSPKVSPPFSDSSHALEFGQDPRKTRSTETFALFVRPCPAHCPRTPR